MQHRSYQSVEYIEKKASEMLMSSVWLPLNNLEEMKARAEDAGANMALADSLRKALNKRK